MDDLIFLTNATKEDFDRSGWTTKRLGEQVALDVNLKPIHGLHPMFVKRSEVEAKLKQYQDENYQVGITALEKLLAPDYSPYRR